MKNYIKAPTVGSVIFTVLLSVITISLVGEYVISRPVNGYIQFACVTAVGAFTIYTLLMFMSFISGKATEQVEETPVNNEPEDTAEYGVSNRVYEATEIIAEAQEAQEEVPVKEAKPKRKPAPRKPKAETPVAEAKPVVKKPRKPRVKKETEIKKEK